MTSKQHTSKHKSPVKKRRVTVNFDAPHATSVSLMGDFNQWNEKKHPMKMGKTGRWEKVIVIEPGRYEYRFLVDGEWQNDPINEKICCNCFGTSNNILDIK